MIDFYREGIAQGTQYGSRGIGFWRKQYLEFCKMKHVGVRKSYETYRDFLRGVNIGLSLKKRYESTLP